jgi:hypothetical protein
MKLSELYLRPIDIGILIMAGIVVLIMTLDMEMGITYLVYLIFGMTFLSIMNYLLDKKTGDKLK